MDGVRTNLPALQAALAQQRQFIRRELGPVVDSRARRFRYSLFRHYKATAPVKFQITAEAEARGWALKRRISPKTGRPVSREFELRAREKSRSFLAQEFVTRDWRAKKDGQNTTALARSRGRKTIGQALVRTAKGETRPHVRIEGFLPGALAIEQRDSILRRVEAEQVKDIAVYVARKIDQRNRQIHARLKDSALQLVKP